MGNTQGWRWIFDRYGRLREEHKRSTKNSEVENWQSGLDDGAFLVLHSFWVSKKWCRKGLARTMIDTLVKKVEAIEIPAVSVLAVPGYLCPEVFEEPLAQNAITQPSSHQRDDSNAKLFLWSMGFRRIGSTPCFAVRIDSTSNQYSFNWAMYEDLYEDRPISSTSDILPNENKWVHGPASRIGLPFGDWEEQLKWFEELKERFPILHATATLPDLNLHDWYCENANIYTTMDWLKTDYLGRNVLHLVIIGLKAKSMQWLLWMLDVGTCNELKTGRNIRGYTPLQELHWRLEELWITDGELALSDKFQGFGKDADNCLLMLKFLELPQSENALPRPSTAFWVQISSNLGLNILWSKTKDGEDQQEHNALETVDYNPPSGKLKAHTALLTASSSKATEPILRLKIDRMPSPDVLANDLGRVITRERLNYGCSCYMCLGGIMSHRLRFFWNMMLKFRSEKVSRRAAQIYRECALRHVQDARIFRAISRVVGQWKDLPTVANIKFWLIYDTRNRTWLNDPMRCDPAIRTALRVLFEFIKDRDEYAGTHRFGQNMEDYRDVMNKIDSCRNDREHGFVARMCKAPLDVPFNDFCFVEEEEEEEGEV
ncbi:hypothetical protein N431DRAFT_500370 [Stipitochalara longipes BDJ]|nr:hypothetical protein N431DRAFT_500370 [Stipitochalara longipes BDJ]